MRHRHRDVLVRDGDDLEARADALGGDGGERLVDRREIGAAIGEEIFDAALGQEREIGLRHELDGDRLSFGHRAPPYGSSRGQDNGRPFARQAE